MPLCAHPKHTESLSQARSFGNCYETMLLTEEMNICKILGLNLKLKNDERKYSSIMTVKLEENVLKCDKREVRLAVTVGPPFLSSFMYCRN